MLSEKNSEKVAVYVALIASILALIITIVNYFAPSGTLFAGSAGASAPAPVPRRSMMCIKFSWNRINFV